MKKGRSNDGVKETTENHEEDKTIREIIVQQNETDWDFALRFAHYLNKHIYPGETLRFGDPEKKIQTLEEKNIKAAERCSLQAMR